MRKLCFLLLIAAMPFAAHATVLTFGPVCSGACVDVPIPSGYGGFTWDPSFYAVSNTTYENNYSNTYGAPSGGAAFNAGGSTPVSLSSSTPFFFNGADFSSFAGNDTYQSYSSLTVTIAGFDSSMNLVGVCSQTLSASSYNFLTCDLANVSTLVFHNDTGQAGHWWLMDDFTYNGTTPEPGSLMLLGSGIVGVAGMLRRKLF